MQIKKSIKHYLTLNALYFRVAPTLKGAAAPHAGAPEFFLPGEDRPCMAPELQTPGENETAGDPSQAKGGLPRPWTLGKKNRPA